MSSESSFDIVSKLDMQELNNAITQAKREIETRFDFKGSKSEITLEKEELVLLSDDDFKLQNVIDILHAKMAKRGIALKNLEYGKIESASLGTVRQRVKLKQGIEADIAKKINIMIRDSKLKVKSQIQGDSIRVTGKSRDDLQKVIQMLKGADLPIDLQFDNFR
ncbi:YajQ family cyclic di-GMP-binding protein [Paenibacillus chitinolyticus]|uniref:Nucleotide-binding protein M5X16_09035 n=1 Tax=Paenibacillus chitinolyticus TaxID=79263 RepID=A0A410WZZ6_9BACL|nr:MULTISPECIES: YajQ family cyclic di-GMP-binding protein [Paenibacillus]MBV6712989.1 YajQ family cyclic di-GMP-binding protein [Paenibacillus chitinolyticus]MCY9592890.1 YajQ family cyclic di-GMP-binding protein [Paenibacillus chitinolyticus]MCY9595917.1 YajQ family cyclic di-GMP-binding protein [Paenibacillus chitinolyticus]MEC0246155.1 YajQ family cyclic di-GMP-binding protein [Paenibacillus chitinolyticus]QAV20018.1 YajQ family cyclic di-GMP-binding protein [Paenibacillus chitinolyticus]